MSGLGGQMAAAQERFDWQLPPDYWSADDDNAQYRWECAMEQAAANLQSPDPTDTAPTEQELNDEAERIIRAEKRDNERDMT